MTAVLGCDCRKRRAAFSLALLLSTTSPRSSSHPSLPHIKFQDNATDTKTLADAIGLCLIINHAVDLSTEHSLHIAPCHASITEMPAGIARARNGRADDIDTNVSLSSSHFEQHQSRKISNLELPLDHEAEDQVTRCY